MCIPEEYNIIEQKLKPIIEKYKLDEVSVNSLVRSSIAIEERNAPRASVIWETRDGKIYSTKPNNLKINLKFALSTIFRLKTTSSQKDIWLVLAILHIVVDLLTSCTKEITEFSGLVLISIYRLQHADKEHITQYMREICPDKEKELEESDLESALQDLEEWGCIRLENGEYFLNEVVTAPVTRN